MKLEQRSFRRHALHLAIGVATVAAGMQVAFAEKTGCQYVNAQIVQSKGGPDTYGCWVSPVTGTLNGTTTSCFVDEIEAGTDMYWDVFSNRFDTKDGTLFATEYDAVAYPPGIFAGVLKVSPASTGKFAGWTGALVQTLEAIHVNNPRGDWANIRVTGYICPPSP